MASIEKLQIRGVRAFDPNDEEYLEFYSPITIIVGANGCGKTTIIECLKYAVTGSFPPGGKGGHSFVHDPRSVAMSQVKASVKLRFNSRANKTIVVTRSMELNMKKDKITFKQLDGVIKMREESTGDIVALSHKCSELDRQIPMLLGVSKAILEHVIFCHQEESSWPFMDSASVKKKFDEIFDSARYTKAIKEFQTTEKEMVAKAKDIKIELAELSANQRTANEYRRDLESQNEQMIEIDEERKQLNEAIEAANKDAEKWDEKVREAEEFTQQMVQIKSEIKTIETFLKTLQDSLEEDLTETHTASDIEKKLSGFDLQVSDKTEELEHLREKEREYNDQIASLREKESELLSRIGRIVAEKEAHEKRLEERSKKMDELASSFQLTFSQSQSPDRSFTSQSTRRANFDSSALTPEEIEVFFDSMDQRQQQLAQALEEYENHAHAENDRVSNELSELKYKLSHVEKEIESNTKETSDKQKEYDSLKDYRAGSSRVRESEIDDMERVVKATRKNFEEASDESKRKDIEAEIARCKKKVDDIRVREERNREALTLLRQMSNAHNEIRNLRDQEENEVEQLGEKLRGHFPSMLKFNIRSSVPRVPTIDADPNGDEIIRTCEALRDEVQEKLESTQDDLRQMSQELSLKQQKVSENAALISNGHNRIDTLKAAIATLEGAGGSLHKAKEAISQAKDYASSQGKGHLVDQTDPDSALSFLSTLLKESLDKAEVTPQSIKWLTKKLTKLASDSMDETTKETNCPCCTKRLSREEGRMLFENLSQVRKRLRDELADTADSEQVDSLKQLRDTISSAIPDFRELDRLNTEAISVEKELESSLKELQTLESERDKAKDNVNEVDVEVTEVRELAGFTSQWVDEATRIASIRSNIKTKREDVSHAAGGDGRDLDSVEKEMEELSKQKDAEVESINRLNTKISDINKHVASLSDQLTKQKERLASKREMLKKEQENATRREALGLEMNQLAENLTKLRQQLDPLKRKIKTKEKEKQDLLDLSRREQKSKSDEYQYFKTEMNSLRDLCREIDSYVDSGKDGVESDVEKERSKLKAGVKAIEKKILSLAPEIQRAQSAVEHHERHKKQLQQNLDILKNKAKRDSLHEQVDRLKRQSSKMVSLEEANDKYDAALVIKNRNAEKLARIEGRYHEINEQVRSIKRKLASEDLKDVDERYRVAKIKHDTTLIAAEDLKKYWTALDKALLKYHGVKIADINKIIRELWLLTYKGEDITNIELVSGQEPGSKASKSYNYRVVMTKGSTDLDMRGRCSAGQRVLASIVVRLALAETFCINCGCIALDEPTVNLDYRNKQGLAVALAQIVASRAAQRNFQLVIITHDEEFVNMMKAELQTHTGFSMPDKYFQVCREMSKDGKYYSKIRHIDWDSL